jgi:RNA polymerase sigma-70 factor (ECF subfamily)
MDTITSHSHLPGDSPATVSDGSLLRRFQRGNDEAATLLYLRYARRLYQLARAQCPADLAQRVDAEDIVQSVFSSFFRRAKQGSYEVPDGEELWKLLLVIALNKIRTKGNFHRAACRDVRATQPASGMEEALDAHDDENALAFLRLVVAEVLERQPEVYRQIVHLRIDGHEVGEIAARVSRSRRTVERVLQEFRETLHGALDQTG